MSSDWVPYSATPEQLDSTDIAAAQELLTEADATRLGQEFLEAVQNGEPLLAALLRKAALAWGAGDPLAPAWFAMSNLQRIAEQPEQELRAAAATVELQILEEQLRRLAAGEEPTIVIKKLDVPDLYLDLAGRWVGIDEAALFVTRDAAGLWATPVDGAPWEIQVKP